MVVKLKRRTFVPENRFESSVIPYGSKTITLRLSAPIVFESSVIPYGSKTNEIAN